MTETERSIGQEVCSSPEELASLFSQWKLSREGQFAERKIVTAIQEVPETNLDLIEPFRDFTFGIYLAQETYPFSKKFPYPAVTIDQTGKVNSAALLVVNNRAKEIVLNKTWLLNPTEEKFSPPATLAFENKSTFRLINASVEEYAHWVFHQAIECRRSNIHIALLDIYYQKTLDEAERSTNLLKGSVDLVEAGLEELKSTGWLRDVYLVITGKKGQRKNNLGHLIRNAYEESKRAELALLEHSSNIEEYMGKIWQNQVGQRYYPWSKQAKYTKEKLEKVLAYKRQKALSARVRMV